MAGIQHDIKQFALKEFFPGESSDAPGIERDLSEGHSRFTAHVKTVSFLEQQVRIQVRAHEADVEHLNDILSITNLVQSKL
jgi:hypothetical protein